MKSEDCRGKGKESAERGAGANQVPPEQSVSSSILAFSVLQLPLICCPLSAQTVSASSIRTALYNLPPNAAKVLNVFFFSPFLWAQNRLWIIDKILEKRRERKTGERAATAFPLECRKQISNSHAHSHSFPLSPSPSCQLIWCTSIRTEKSVGGSLPPPLSSPRSPTRWQW